MDPASDPASASAPAGPSRAWPGLLAVCLVLLALAWTRPMAIPDEGRYGEVGRWMLLSGDWRVPRLDGIAFFHKPPLTYWIEAAAMAMFGVSVPAVRAAAMGGAVVMLLTTWALVRAWWGPALAWRTALVLGSSVGWLLGGQYANHDMLVAAWMTLGIACLAWSFERGGERPHAGWALVGALACALGVMTKGLIGVLLPGLVMTLWLVASGHWRRAHRLPWLRGVAILGAVCLPWMLVTERAHPGMLEYLFLTQQFGRFASSTFNNPQPVWFYGAVTVILLGVWTPWLLAQAWRGARGHPAWRALCGTPARARLVWLAWLWVVAILGFFSIPHSKLIGYALPVLPPLAVLVALGWSCTSGLWARARRWWGGTLALALAVGVAANWQVGVTTLRKNADDVAAAMRCVAAPDAPLWLNGDYPYDLPFLRQATTPMHVAEDWPRVLREVPDSWQAELADGAALDPEGGRVLRDPQALAQAATQAGQWLVMRRRSVRHDASVAMGWEVLFEGRAWTLYASRGTPAPDGAAKACLDRLTPGADR